MASIGSPFPSPISSCFIIRPPFVTSGIDKRLNFDPLYCHTMIQRKETKCPGLLSGINSVSISFSYIKLVHNLAASGKYLVGLVEG